MVQKNRENAACTVCTWQEAIIENPEIAEGADNSEELAPVGD
ncbi:uncharacterized protein METZ01_LOCUS469704 [marine metagenome]|uniref:Uncharacterized protein n=1 Tax=marine metagenome TaxID=408172 RepID=A0A383BAP1_9ZZZZ